MIVNVLVELSNKNVDKTYSYTVPKELITLIKVGIRVLVPFGKQTLEGFVLSIDKTSELKDLKEIIEVIDQDIILNEELLELGKYISKETLSTLISSYQVMLPKALKASSNTNINIKNISLLTLNNKDLNKLNKSSLEIIELFKDNDKVLKTEANKISVSSTKTLLKKGILKEELVEVYRLNKEAELTLKYPLTKDQIEIVEEVKKSKDNIFLLHGVTGSGKTEVYMELIEYYISLGKSAIVLVPEISLTEQMTSRFRSRFGKDIAILHSRLSHGEKYDEYRRIARGEVNIVIGARSAIFAPLKDIGIIIIDEEHTSSYKQDNNPKYNAIDIAKKRIEYHQAKLILGSATPTLESYARAKKGVYHLLELKRRVNDKHLPKVEIVDMNIEMKKIKGHFSRSLETSIKECLENNEQVMLLLNRRGYSSYCSCKSCGHVEKCKCCDITLTFHKSSSMLRCHYCGYATKQIEICPECKEKSISNLGLGTEKIEEEIKKLFPQAKVVRMDFDTTSKKGSHEKIINDFKDHKYDILLGTQMISKGLDFSNVTLVGVINADTSLNIPDFRSSEHTFNLLCQTSGRSGRGEKTGKVIIQTFNKDHYAIELAKTHDYKTFYEQEMSIRKTLNYPPFYYLVGIKIMSVDYEIARNISSKVSAYLKENLKSTIILGPSVANVFRVNNIYRFQIVLKYKKEDNLHEVLNKLLEHYQTNSKVRIDIDFNPNSI